MSADESLVGVHDAAALIRAEAVDVFSLKVSKNGGIAKCRQIAQTADAFGIKCLMNSMLEFGITQAASLQLGCTLSNLLPIGHAYGSVVRMADDITDFGRNVSGATVRVPDGPGLGVALDEEKLKKYTLEITWRCAEWTSLNSPCWAPATPARPSPPTSPSRGFR